MLFPHQKEVHAELLATAGLFFGGTWKNCGIRPRFSRFLSGPTGSGKTHVVKNVAAQLGTPILVVSSTNWMPLGCSQKGARPTWCDIASFCQRNERGIIFVDELDKFGGVGSSWMDHIRVEAFQLLDQIFPDTALASDDEYELSGETLDHSQIADRLLNNILIVGAGAFQSIWSEKRAPHIGFGQRVEDRSNDISKAMMSRQIPAEITNRFAGPILVLRPLALWDYKEMLQEAASCLDEQTAKIFLRRGFASLRDAASNQLGCRWIEELLLHSLLELERSKTKCQPHTLEAEVACHR
jgi:SpoVK/Ycf46/Vps4 family AAA+-type ATPase